MGIIARNCPKSAQPLSRSAGYGGISISLRRAACATALVILAATTALAPSASVNAAPSGEPHATSRVKPRKTPKPAPTPIALPDDVKAKIPVYKPGSSPFHDGEQLIFQASWIGIPAAQARVEFHKRRKDPSQWLAEAWVETNSVTDVFYKMRDYMREKIAIETLHTDELYLIQHESTRLNYYTVSFNRPAQLVTVEKKNHKGTHSTEFVASDPWGPLSASMMALTLDFKAGKTFAFDVFSGSQRYVFSFDVQKRERIRTPLGDFDAWRVVPDVIYLSDGKLRSQAHGTVLWISADEHHLPLRIEAQAFIGYVRADLIRIDGTTTTAER
jgi:hypothetical protein